MPHKILVRLALAACLLAAPYAYADNGYTGPPYGPGTAIPNKPNLGQTFSPGASPGGPPGFSYQFRNDSRLTINNFFRTYWLCALCGYSGGAYTTYQPGDLIVDTPYQPFPPELASQLPPPPPGTQYVFANRNALLVAQNGGRILDVIPLAGP